MKTRLFDAINRRIALHRNFYAALRELRSMSTDERDDLDLGTSRLTDVAWQMARAA